MQIPGAPDEASKLYRNLRRECDASRDDRRSVNSKRRQSFLTGSDTNTAARYNKIFEHVKASSAYLYSPESPRFGVALPPRYGDKFIEEQEAARDEIHRLIHDSDAAMMFAMLVEAAHWQDTAVAKLFIDRNEPAIDVIADSADIGVLEESRHSWDRQEALVHHYTVGLPAFRRRLSMIRDDKVRTALWAEAQEHAGPHDGRGHMLPRAVESILLTSASPSMVGVVQDLSAGALGIPVETEDVVRLSELWVWDDDLREGQGDYRVVTLFDATERVMWANPNPLVAGKHPFYGLTLNPLPGYLWGVAPIQYLLALQLWHEGAISDIKALFDLSLDPPLFGSGIQGVVEEKLSRLRAKGGIFSTPSPGAKVDRFTPTWPPETFGVIELIGKMFARQGGLPEGMRGQTEAGVRSGEQAVAQALMGAGPSMNQAMLVEDCFEDIATDMLLLHRRVNHHPLRKPSGEEFLLSQMPEEVTVRVSAHSASPLFQQQITQKAVLAVQHHAIDKEDFVTLLGLPMDDLLRHKARRLARQEAELGQKRLEIEKEKADAKMLAAKK